jgi:hypothetical protein
MVVATMTFRALPLSRRGEVAVAILDIKHPLFVFSSIIRKDVKVVKYCRFWSMGTKGSLGFELPFTQKAPPHPFGCGGLMWMIYFLISPSVQ